MSTRSSSAWVRIGSSRDGQVVGRGQALLLRAVAGVGLDVLVEDLADERGDELVRRHRSETADRVAPERVRPGRPDVDRTLRECASGWRIPSDGVGERAVAAVGEPVEHARQVVRTDIARSKPGRHRQHPRHHHALGGSVVQRSLRSRGSAGCRRLPVRRCARPRRPTVRGAGRGRDPPPGRAGTTSPPTHPTGRPCAPQRVDDRLGGVVDACPSTRGSRRRRLQRWSRTWRYVRPVSRDHSAKASSRAGRRRS